MNSRQRTAIAGGAAAATGVGLAIYAGQYPTAQIYGETIHRERGAGKRIALTYDDGPNPEQTPRLLELLARYDAKATFFLIGGWAEREPALIRQTVAAGHAIGNHTYTHPTMPAHGAERIRDELRRCREAVEASGEHFSTVLGYALMRPPYGRRRPGTLRTMREEGYVPVTWSITGYDWRAHTTAKRSPADACAWRRRHHPAARRLRRAARRRPQQVDRDHRGDPGSLVPRAFSCDVPELVAAAR